MWGLALAVGPRISRWLGAPGKAARVSVEEQWLTSRGRWDSGCVGWEAATARPGLAPRLPSRGPWAWRWGGRPWRQRTQVPKVLRPEGLQA